MKPLACALCLLVAFPALAQDRPAKKRAAPAHAKPTPQQIRKFNELEKKKAVRAPSPK